MKHDLSKLFSGEGTVKPAFEVVTSRPGPFTGRPMRKADNRPEVVSAFYNAQKAQEKAEKTIV